MSRYPGNRQYSGIVVKATEKIRPNDLELGRPARDDTESDIVTILL